MSIQREINQVLDIIYGELAVIQKGAGNDSAEIIPIPQLAELRDAALKLGTLSQQQSQMFESIPAGIVIISKNLEILQANQQAHTQLEAAPDGLVNTLFTEYLCQNNATEILPALADSAKAKTDHSMLLRTNTNPEKKLFCIFRKNGLQEPESYITILMLELPKQDVNQDETISIHTDSEHDSPNSLNVLLNSNEQLAIQIRLREIIEEQLKLSEERYRLFFMSMKQGVALLRAVHGNTGDIIDFTYIDVNPAFEQIIRNSRTHLLNKRIGELFPDFLRTGLASLAEVVISGISAEFQDIFYTLDRTVSVSTFRPYPDHCVVVISDITARVESEKSRQASENLYRTLVETSGDAIVLTDLQGKILFANKHKAELHKYNSPEELIGANVFEHFIPDEIPAVMQQLQRLITDGSVFFESIAMDLEGRHFPIEVSSSILCNEEGVPVSIMSTVRDISERKAAEQQIQKSLREKEILIGEIHHRVKNNFQVINSLLNLQTHLITDEKVSGVLEISRNRIKAMSIVHEIMYQNKDFESVNLQNYVNNLCSFLRNAFSHYVSNVELIISVPEIRLSIDQISPGGLVLNELISNAFAHAFHNVSNPIIWVTFSQPESNTLCLSVKDNGCGLPDGYEIDDSKSLGLPLVTALADQLRGELTIKHPEVGTEFTIIFPHH